MAYHDIWTSVHTSWRNRGHFVEAVMSEAPVDAWCTKFADYLTDNYVTQESRWAEPPSDARRTTNGPESFHCHYNAQFYSSHPSIFVFLNTILQIQTVNYIKIRHISEVARQSRTEKEKLDFLFDLWRKYQSGRKRVQLWGSYGHFFRRKWGLSNIIRLFYCVHKYDKCLCLWTI